ncbi:MAG TPA: hypothetical protein VE623_22685 [Acidimicrobiales bacterium]|nr:hypothetical protein [Acidimicrobiales bacterium]
MRGSVGFATEQHGEVILEWQEAPGVLGSLRCGGDLDTGVRIADSLDEVQPNDPRIATAPPG